MDIDVAYCGSDIRTNIPTMKKLMKYLFGFVFLITTLILGFLVAIESIDQSFWTGVLGIIWFMVFSTFGLIVFRLCGGLKNSEEYY